MLIEFDFKTEFLKQLFKVLDSPGNLIKWLYFLLALLLCHTSRTRSTLHCFLLVRRHSSVTGSTPLPWYGSFSSFSCSSPCSCSSSNSRSSASSSCYPASSTYPSPTGGGGAHICTCFLQLLLSETGEVVIGWWVGMSFKSIMYLVILPCSQQNSIKMHCCDKKTLVIFHYGEKTV